MNKMRYLNKNKSWLFACSIGLMFIMFSCSDDEEPMVDTSLFPKADFTASATTVESGSTITFTDISTNAPFLWTWNFAGGDPSYSNQKNPTVLYPGAGTYSVTMKSRNEFGADEIIKEGYIEITAPPVVDIDTKAVLRYTFEDNLESDLDKGNMSINASTSGAAQFGIRPGGGGAYVFTGTNPLEIPGYTGINGAGARSVALWLKTTHASTSGLVHWGASGTFSRSSFKMQNTGVARFEYQGGGHNTTPVINDDQWHHVAYTYDGNTIRIYIDGIEDFNISDRVLRTGEAGETDVNIGSQLGGSIYQGMMDDVRIFDVALSPEDIKVLSEIK
jgi:PKD repeat protein